MDQVVLEGLKATSRSRICATAHQIQQTQYYEWKNHFLRHGEKVFELGIVGYSFRFKSETRDWLEALNQAVMNQLPKEQPALISANGCQPTSEVFMKASSAFGIKQIFTSRNNPKGNADTERVMRTIKENLVWPREWDFPFELERALKQ